jgi:DHA1 family tetracycline resistance protein-like MFS transporter
MSATSIIGPLIMTNIFAYFTATNAPIHFAGAPFIVSAVLTIISSVFAYRSLKK